LGHAKNGDFAIPTPNAPKTEALRFARFTLTEAFGSKIQVAATSTDTKNIRLTK